MSESEFQLLTKSPGYGATVEEKHAEEEEEDVDDDEEEEDDDDYFDGTASFHLNKGCARELAANIWTSMRATPSFVSYGDEYELVPTLIKDNITLVADPNLESHERGRLYYAEKAFYSKEHEPEYAITVNQGIYQRIVSEIDTAKSVPCGLYFCCHGGDGAHTGVSHDDYVDIVLAWVLVCLIFGSMAIISFL